MRITRLIARNYRTLEDIDVTFPTDYCTISGHNNAGKSSVIRLLRLLLEQQTSFPLSSQVDLDYLTDKTQWAPDENPIEIEYFLCLDSRDDSSLVNFIAKYRNKPIKETTVECQISMLATPKNRHSQKMSVAGTSISDAEARGILKQIRSSNSLFLHNSTLTATEYMTFRGGRFAPAYPLVLSSEDHAALAQAEQAVQKKIKNLTRTHKSELEGMLGKLKDKYSVEFSTPDSYSSRKMPFDINLKDRSAEVPLGEWGSGTQNRTRILMSILQAKRIKSGAGVEDCTTPIVVIEEPESFLHPTAQAEFGTLLRTLSSELKIQIIASTHSPYMLNQENPSSNILLRRKKRNRQYLGSEVADTKAKEWMAPFAEHLGLIPPEFEHWKPIFARTDSLLLLVEGEIDVEYFEHLRNHYQSKFSFPKALEIVAYGGKDTLKNIPLVKFTLNKARKTLITFDLDALAEVRRPLTSAGLIEGADFIAIGVDKPGRKAIEGLLPERVMSAVNARETELILQLQDGERRKGAKSALKRRYLEEFKRINDFTEAELDPLIKLGSKVNKRFSSD